MHGNTEGHHDQGDGTPAAPGNASGDIGAQASALAGNLADEGKQRLEQQRGVAADTVERLAASAEAAASALGDDDVGHLSRHVADAADGMRRFSEGLRDKTADELLRDVGRLARDNPALFIAGGIAAGFALTRFARASTAGSASAGGDEGGGSSDRLDRSTGSGQERHGVAAPGVATRTPGDVDTTRVGIGSGTTRTDPTPSGGLQGQSASAHGTVPTQSLRDGDTTQFGSTAP